MATKDCTDYEKIGLDAYTVVRELGHGVGSTTQLVKLGENSPLYVRKVITEEYANTEAWQALARVSHPLVPRVREQCWRDGSYEVVYDYIPGESLAELVGRSGCLNERYAASIMLDVADAAAALHEAGIVHRDISPGNVIVDRKGRAHLTDLGIARVVDAGQSHDTTLLGTMGFAAPEQYGFAQTDARSDVYSMGRLLAYVCTGLLPGVASDSFDDPEFGLETLSPGLASVIETACAFEPSTRFQSAQALATALSTCMDGLPASTTSTTAAPKNKAVPAEEDTPDTEGEKGPRWLRGIGWTLYVIWGLLAFVCAAWAFTAYPKEAATLENPWYMLLSAVLFCAYSAYCAYHTWHALNLSGIYKQWDTRVRRLLLRYVIGYVLWYVCSMVIEWLTKQTGLYVP